MSTDSPGDWRLYDMGEPLDGINGDYPFSVVRSEDDLRSLLHDHRCCKPTMLFLLSPTRDGFKFGLSPEWGVIQCRLPSSEHFAGWAVSGLADESEDALVEFAGEGVEEPFWIENVLPVDAVVTALLGYFRTGGVPADLRWGDRVLKCQ